MPADVAFQVMGCTAHVMVVGAESAELATYAHQRLDDLEQRWSRFLEDSEISRCIRVAGTWCPVSRETLLLVQRVVEGYTVTFGRFDPTVLGDVLRAGYTRSFDDFAADDGRIADGWSSLDLGAASIEVDRTLGRVRLPSGVGFDPGGIGKGLAADLVVDELVAHGATGACVNLGGDVTVRGDAPEGGPWRIVIEDPRDGSTLCELRVTDGAVATSARTRRKWIAEDGGERHHLIDPSTGRSAATEVLSVSVVAAHGWQAEVLAKDVLVGTVRDGAAALARVEELGAAGLLVDARGPMTTSSWSRFAIPVGTEDGRT